MDVPIVFSSGEFALGAGTTQPDVGRLQPTNRIPVYIDEIRFYVEELSGDGFIRAGGSPFSILKLKLTLGNWDITASYNSAGLRDTFIPVWLLDGHRQSQMNKAHIVDAFSANRNAFTFSWKLPRPLYVPAGMVLMPQIKLGSVANDLSLGEISYVGRATEDPTPSLIAVPYATGYEFTATSPGMQTTPELALGNPFRKSLFVQRLIGRLLAQDGDTLPEGRQPQLLDVDFWLTRGTSKISLTRHGRAGIDAGGNAFGNWGDVFDQETRAWDASPTLGPSEYLTAVIDFHASNTVVDGGNLLYWPAIGLVGFREEAS